MGSGVSVGVAAHGAVGAELIDTERLVGRGVGLFVSEPLGDGVVVVPGQGEGEDWGQG